MITEHQFISKYPIKRNSKKLVVGTIHPHNLNKFKIPFFYGNELSLWKILKDAFPEELDLNLTSILNFLDNRKISISDMILKCKRLSNSSLDKDLIPLEINESIINEIKQSDIEEILFTSGFGINNAFKLFYCDVLNQKITHKIKSDKEVILDKKYMGRSIKLTILYSPSGMANVGISRSKLYLSQKVKYQESKKPIYDFKVDYYKNAFSHY